MFKKNYLQVKYQFILNMRGKKGKKYIIFSYLHKPLFFEDFFKLKLIKMRKESPINKMGKTS